MRLVDGSAVDALLAKLAAAGARGAFSSGDRFTVRRVASSQPTFSVCASVAKKAFGDGLLAETLAGHWRLTQSGRARVRALRSLPRAEALNEVTPAQRPAFDPRESPLAWLRCRTGARGSFISEDQFEAGERLRADFTLGHMMPAVTTKWSLTSHCSSGRGGDSHLEPSERASAARERVRRALAVVGPELSGVLIDVVCHLKGLDATERAAGWPQRSGKLVLRLALNSLARHYGLRPSPSDAERPVAVRHWGGEDYRPAVD